MAGDDLRDCADEGAASARVVECLRASRHGRRRRRIARRALHALLRRVSIR